MRLHIEPPEHMDEIGKAGIVWSHGRYAIGAGIIESRVQITILPGSDSEDK
ncbi:MAG: hypothetical protein GY809_02570 [Planctomycetes bacterium]|nr:hypothetical protein [Planctomycetota bacterium]